MVQRESVITNIIWRFLERFGAELVTFIVTIVLARILSPDDYGIVAILNVLIGFFNIFINIGLSSALIQKKDADDLDFSSVFYLNMAFSVGLYLILFLAAPYIGAFYNNRKMIPMVRTLGLLLPVSGVKNIQVSYVSRTLQFKRFFFATLGGTVGAGVLGILLAMKGFGAWALVAQSLFNNAIDTAILWFTVKWKPKKEFSLKRVKSLFDYGWKLFASSLLASFSDSLTTLIIGKKYTSIDLAYYDKGRIFPSYIMTNLNTSIDNVLLPAVSREQENTQRVYAITSRAIKTSSYLIFPMMMGLATCADPLISLILTDKWLPTSFYMRIFCFSFALYPLHTANLNAIKAVGRSDIYLIQETVKRVFNIAIIFITMWISVKAMAYGVAIVGVFSVVVNAWPNRKLINYSLGKQLIDIGPIVILTIAMGVIVNIINRFGLEPIKSLMIQIPTGVAVYLLGSKIFRVESFEYLLDLARSFKLRTK